MSENLTEAVAKQKKLRELKPKKMDLVRAFGEEHLREGKREWRYEFKKRDGSVDMKKLHAFKEMMRPADRLEASIAEGRKMPEKPREKRRGPSFTVPALPWHKERKLNLAEEHDEQHGR